MSQLPIDKLLVCTSVRLVNVLLRLIVRLAVSEPPPIRLDPALTEREQLVAVVAVAALPEQALAVDAVAALPLMLMPQVPEALEPLFSA